MSYHFLEYQKAVSEISESLHLDSQNPLDKPIVQWVGLCDFGVNIDDCCMYFKLWNKINSEEYWLIVSLKNPWLGIFLSNAKQFRDLKNKSWAKTFDGAVDLNLITKGKILEKLTCVENDRIFKMNFLGGMSIRFEMFPARPNWVVEGLDQVYQWRESKSKLPEVKIDIRSKLENRVNNVSQYPRNFSSNSEQESKSWLERAYVEYKEKRFEALYLQTYKNANDYFEDKISKNIRLKSEVLKQLKNAERAEDIKMQGELLKSVLYQFKKTEKTDHVKVGDVRIKCDPQKTVAENADLYFKNYKKLLRSRKEIEPRVAHLDSQMKKDREMLVEIANFKKKPNEKYSESLFKFLKIEAVQIALKAKQPEAKKQSKIDQKFEKSGVKKFISKEGISIWIGKTHEENEELVIRLARGNDIWLHLKSRPGAHGIIQLPKNKTASLETLLDAATLVAHYSGVSVHDKAEVDYTFRKYVKRVPGGKKNASQFLVTYSQNKTLDIQIQRDRIDRLFTQI